MRPALFAVLMLGVLASHASVVAQSGVRADGHYLVQFDQEHREPLIGFIALLEQGGCTSWKAQATLIPG